MCETQAMNILEPALPKPLSSAEQQELLLFADQQARHERFLAGVDKPKDSFGAALRSKFRPGLELEKSRAENVP